MWAKSNPFNPNGIVPTSLFAGRHEYCYKIFKKIAETKNGRPSSFYLYGERGIGKSALARLIGHIAKINSPDFYNLNFLMSYYPVEPGQMFRNVLEASLNQLLASMPSSWISSLGDTFGNIMKNGKLTLGAFGHIDVCLEGGSKEANITVRDQVISILSNTIAGLKSGQEKKDGILIFIDEMQHLEDIEVAAPLLRGMLSTLDFKELGHISFILIGLDDSFKNFVEGDHSVLRAFDPIRLDVMPQDETIEVLQKGFKSVGLTWDEDHLHSKSYVTGGYPHSIQLIGHHLVEADTNGNIEEDDWNIAIKQTAKELRDKDFSEMYSFAGQQTARDKILNVLAVLGNMPRKELASNCKEAYEINNTYQYLSDLKNRGAIKVLNDGNIELHSSLFRTAILTDLSLSFGEPLGEMWKRKIISKIPSEVSPNNKK